MHLFYDGGDSVVIELQDGALRKHDNVQRAFFDEDCLRIRLKDEDAHYPRENVSNFRFFRKGSTNAELQL